jgi:hypothetical protein
MKIASELHQVSLEIVATARRMLSGNLSFIEGARRIVALRDAARAGLF